MRVPCPLCRELHDIEALEPSFLKPDDYLLAVDEPDCQVLEAKDACAFRTAQHPSGRYFLRVILPFRVAGLSAECSWGVWVEVSAESFERVQELWQDPEQSLEPPFSGRLANAIHGYDDSRTVTGWVTLVDPARIPTFRVREPGDHPLVRDQERGVTPERVMEWLLPIYHAGTPAGEAD